MLLKSDLKPNFVMLIFHPAANGCYEKGHNTVEEEKATRRLPAGLRRPKAASPRNIALLLSDLVPSRKIPQP